jgi:hypothetical protein
MAESRLIFILGTLVIFFAISVNVNGQQDDFLYFKKAQPITQQTTEILDDQPQGAISLGIQESRINCIEGYTPFKSKDGVTCVRSRRRDQK